MKNILREKKRLTNHYTHLNQVQLIRGGRQYFSTLVKIIREAKNSIHLQVYIFIEDETGEDIARALIDAAQRGVKVFIVADGYASQGLSHSYVDRFQKAGIHFRFFEPIFRSQDFYFGRRLHHKVIVVDSRVTMVGGINISNRYNDMPDNPAWLDWALLVEGELASHILQASLEIWTKSRRRVKQLLQQEKLPEHFLKKECLVRMRRNDWVKRKNQISKSYLEMFRNASSHMIIMSSYFLPGRHFRRKMEQAAMRGVKIKLILSGTSDIRLAKHAERYIYRWMLRNKMEIYEFHRSVLHGKLATYDGHWVTGGSYNVNNISAYASIELNLDMENPEFALSVQKTLEQIIANDCKQITEEEYRMAFNIFQRFIQYVSYWMVRIIFYVFTFYFKQH